MTSTMHFAGDVALLRDSSAIAGVRRDYDAALAKLRPLGAPINATYTLVVLREERPRRDAPLKLSTVVGSWCEVVKAHGARSFLADGHNREPAREFASAAGVTIEDAPEGAKGKEEVFLVARKLIAEGRVHIPNHPRLIEQLASVVAKPMEGGGLRISVPRRAGLAHGDLVSAFVLALWDAERGGGHVRFMRPRTAQFPYRTFGSGRGF